MKSLQSIILVVALCAIHPFTWATVGVIAVTTQGCSTASSAAYKTLGSVGAADDTAMKIAANLRNTGKLTDAQWKLISDAQDKYLPAYNAADLACALAVESKGTFPASADLSALASDVVNLVNSFNK